IANNGQYVYNYKGTIAHIMIFIQTPTHLRLRLLHLRKGQVSVSIQEKGKELHCIQTEEIPQELGLGEFELGEFEAGRHELELVVENDRGWSSWYGLRDITVEFFDNSPSLPPDDSDENVCVAGKPEKEILHSPDGGGDRDAGSLESAVERGPDREAEEIQE